MRTPRRFQPTIDQLCQRIAPSTAAPAPQIADSDMPETGVLQPLILDPIPPTPPPTLLC
jgi:hypothetical protein